MKFPNYKGRSQEMSVKLAKARLDAIEREKLKENRAELVGNVHFMEHETSFVAVQTWIRYTKAPTGTTSAVDEDTNVNVKAYLTIEDPFGDGVPITSPFDGNYISLPIGSEWKSKTAYYHGYYQPGNNYRRNMSWDLFSPASVAHTAIPSTYRSFECNIPGNSSFDRYAFIYYMSHSDFNLVNNQSHSIWFYPTAIASTTEAFTYLQYRWQNATNWYAVVYETASPNHIIVFVTEGGAATVKREVNQSIVFNSWNNVTWAYNATSNALTIKHNNVADTITPSDTLTAPYTTDLNMYLGGVPLQVDKRIEGYLGMYHMWWQILTGTQMSNMWNHGTIV